MGKPYTASGNRMLIKHVIRSSFRIKGSLILIALICAIAFSVIGGLYSAIDNLWELVNAAQRSANYADLELITAPEDIKNFPNFDLQELKYVESRFLAKANLLEPDTSTSALFIGQDSVDRQKINQLLPIKGTLPKKNELSAVAIERHCAEFYHKKVGDTLTLSLNEKTYLLNVKSIVESPEYLIAPFNPGSYVPSSSSLCVIFGNKQILTDQLGFEAFNNLLFKFKHFDDQIKSKVFQMASKRLAVDFALTQEEQFSRLYLAHNLNAFKLFVPVIILILLLMSMISILFVMHQWINKERSTISIFITLGYERSQILLAYAMPLTFIVIGGILLGFPLSWLTAWCFELKYAQAIGLIQPQIELIWQHLLNAALFIFISTLAGVYFPLRSIFSVSPQEALHGDSLPDHQTRFFQRIVAAVKGPFFITYPIRNLIRHWHATLFAIISIALMIASTISFNITMTSMKQSVFHYISRDHWQAVLELDAPLWDEQQIMFQEAVKNSHWSVFDRGAVQVIAGNKIESAYLIGVDGELNVRNPQLVAGTYLNKNIRNGVLAERSLTLRHHLHVGDMLNLKSRNKLYKVQILGIHSGAIPNEIIMDKELAGKILSLDEQFTGIFLISPLLSRQDLISISSIPGVVSVKTKGQIYTAIEKLSANMEVLIKLSIFISLLLSIAFLRLSMGFTLDAKKRDFAVLKAIGFSRKIILTTLFIEIFMTLFLAVLIALPVSLALAFILNAQLTEVWFTVSTFACYGDFMNVILPTIIFIPLAILPAIIDILNDSPMSLLGEKTAS